MIAATLSKCLSSSSASWSLYWFMPGIIESMLVIGPIRRSAVICSRKSSRVKDSPPTSLAVIRSFCSSSKAGLGLLDEGHHVAHAEDAARHPLGVEDVEVLELLAGRREQDRLAGDLPDRQRGATARVTVQFGEYDAGDAHAVTEGLGRRHRVLADHGVDDEEHLVGAHRVPDVGRLGHHLRVDAEPAGRVDDHDVAHLPAGVLDRVAGHPYRVPTGMMLAVTADDVPGLGCEDLDPGPLAQHLKLVDRVGALQVRRDEQRLVAQALEVAGELGRRASSFRSPAGRPA